MIFNTQIKLIFITIFFQIKNVSKVVGKVVISPVLLEMLIKHLYSYLPCINGDVDKTYVFNKMIKL